MISKNYYKKIFVLAVALVLLFAPVGMATRGSNSGFGKLSLNINFVDAQSSSPPPAPTSAPAPTPVAPTGASGGSAPVIQSGAGAGSAATPQTPSFFSCASNAVTCSVYYVALTINGVMGVFVSIGAFLVRLGLQFNDNIYNSPEVQTGFSVALAIANLGFVLGIIIIAIATIIRNQTYGIKQLLWKLVFMAILVNFGLVITAPIVGFASNMSNYFINATSPGSMSVAGYEGYAQTMTAAFQPQDLQLGGTQNAAATSANAAAASVGAAAGCSGVPGAGPGLALVCAKIASLIATVSTSDNFWQMIMAMMFDIAFSSLIVFTFLCLAILLIVRYLMLAGLLVVLPLAWLTYVFPKFDNSYSKWWNAFIKWTFFPPLALFFIYLAFITATNTTGAAGANAGTSGNAYEISAAGLPSAPANNPNGNVELALGYETGLSGVIQQAADEVLLVGLTIMGLMFALSLSGKAGSTVVNGGAAVSKAVGGYVGKQTKKGARAGFRAVGGNKVVEKMRGGQLGGLQKIPLIGWAAGRGASLAGRAIEPHLTNQALVDAAKKNVPENIEQVKQNLKGNMNSEDRFAHLSKLIEKGELTKDQMVGNQTVGEFLDSNPGLIANYGFTKGSKDADKVLGSDKDMRSVQKKIALGKKNDRDTTAAEEELATATDKFVAKLEKGDVAKMNLNEIFKKPDASKGETENPFAAALAKSFATQAPQFAASAMPKMKAATLKQFTKIYEGQIKLESGKSLKLNDIKNADEEIEALQQQKSDGNPETERLKREIEGVNAMSGSDDWKKEQVRRRNDLISQEMKKIDARIKTAQANRKTIEDGLSDEEKNLVFASKSFKSSLNANATFGAAEPSITPAPQPQEQH